MAGVMWVEVRNAARSAWERVDGLEVIPTVISSCARTPPVAKRNVAKVMANVLFIIPVNGRPRTYLPKTLSVSLGVVEPRAEQFMNLKTAWHYRSVLVISHAPDA